MTDLKKYFEQDGPKIIFGLGNFPKKYTMNRHNVGRNFVLFLKRDMEKRFQSIEIDKKDFSLTKFSQIKIHLFFPNSYMNECGVPFMKYFKNSNVNPENILVVHDDLDLKLGKYKVNFAKGPKKHNGIDSIEKCLGTDKIYRLRIGIENREKASIAGKDYVLQDFQPAEMQLMLDVYKEIDEEVMKNIFSLTSFIHK